MPDEGLTLMATGDLVLEMPDANPYFSNVKSTLKTADIVVGQGEVVFTDRPAPFEDSHAPPCDPRNMNALKNAGFHVITLAGNHVYDSGRPGIEDTIRGLNDLGIATVGAGLNISEHSGDRQGIHR